MPHGHNTWIAVLTRSAMLSALPFFSAESAGDGRTNAVRSIRVCHPVNFSTARSADRWAAALATRVTQSGRISYRVARRTDRSRSSSTRRLASGLSDGSILSAEHGSCCRRTRRARCHRSTHSIHATLQAVASARVLAKLYNEHLSFAGCVAG